MDIDLLSKMVKELILDEDRVVLPGLGCFVAEIVPATFSDKGYTINPPYRRLYFRSKPDEGEALIDFYAKSNNVEYTVAERIIKDFLAELKPVLLSRKAVVFPGLGRLRATKENNIFFVADEDLDIYPEGFGLEPISLKTHQETREEVRAAVADLKQIIAEPEHETPAEPGTAPVPAKYTEPVTEPEPLPQPEHTPVPDPEPAPETVPEPVPEPVSEPTPEPTPEPDPAEAPAQPEVLPDAKKSGKPFLKVLLVLAAILLLVAVAYMAVGRLCPELIDKYLYSPEELEILNHNTNA